MASRAVVLSRETDRTDDQVSDGPPHASLEIQAVEERRYDSLPPHLWARPRSECERVARDIAALERQVRECDRFQASADDAIRILRQARDPALPDWEARHAIMTRDRQRARAVAV